MSFEKIMRGHRRGRLHRPGLLPGRQDQAGNVVVSIFCTPDAADDRPPPRTRGDVAQPEDEPDRRGDRRCSSSAVGLGQQRRHRHSKPADRVTVYAARRQVDVNLMGTVWGCAEAVRRITAHGRGGAGGEPELDPEGRSDHAWRLRLCGYEGRRRSLGTAVGRRIRCGRDPRQLRGVRARSSRR